MSASLNPPSSPTKALRRNQNATLAFSKQDARAELRYTMRQKTTIIPLQDMIKDFLPDAKSSKAIPNVFTKVPKFSSEKDMYAYITETLNKSGQFSGKKFVTTAYKPDPLDPSRQAIDAGMYDSKDVPPMEYTASGTEESRRCLWALVQLLIECKLESVGQDPFDETADDNEATAAKRREVLGQILSYVELAFKFQQREFVWMILFLGRSARIVRFDRSGIIASEKFNYSTRGAEFTEFLVRWARLGRTHHGHDPTATRLTAPLTEQLKQYGAAAAERDPDDHLSVSDEESKVERWFAVGKPHFYAGGVAGRGTRGYVAAPLSDDGEAVDPQAEFVYLKDAWRVDQEEMEKEGTILKALNDAEVPYVPTLLYHGDLAHQKSMSYELWPDFNKAETHERCPLKSHQHYRLVVAEVGKPLSEFENGFQLVWALFCCISAHEKACEAGYIHRDISAGNILLYKGASGRWVGLLNDWELSKKFTEGVTTFGGRQLDRTGTWQFMSVHILLKPTRLVGIPDDLESFLHVLIYFAVRFLPHNLADDLVGRFLYSYFDDYTDGAPGFTCGLLKYTAIKRGLIDLTTITGQAVDAEGNDVTHPLTFFTAHANADGEDDSVVPGKSHPINALITELLDAFQALYAKEDAVAVRSTDNDDTRGMSLPPDVRDLVQQMKAKRSQGASTSTSTSRTRSTDNAILADKVKAHEPMKMLILEHFDEQKWKWPEHDKGKDKKPLGGYVPAKENTLVGSTIRTGTKRAAEDGDEDEESMSRRVRSRSRV